MAIKLAVLASGRGSNFEAIAEAVRTKQIANAEVISLITHNPLAGALARAKELNIPTVLLTEKDRTKYHSVLAETLEKLNPDWICLAGYMRIVPPEIVEAWPNRIINIHPSLLPAFPGLKAQERAIKHGVRYTGCTVHFVSEEMDEGPILEQAPCEIFPDDTFESLAKRMLPLEHAAYVRALARLTSKSYRLEGRAIRWTK